MYKRITNCSFFRPLSYFSHETSSMMLNTSLFASEEIRDCVCTHFLSKQCLPLMPEGIFHSCHDEEEK